MEKIFEKIAIILALFGFKSIESSEKNRAYVWRHKYVSSSKIARNYILAIARTLGADYSFSVRYTGPKGMIQKSEKYILFTENISKEAWPSRWSLDVFHEDECVGCFVFFIK